MVRGVRRRASDLLALSEMIQEALDHGGLGDEFHHAHLASAARTHQGVDFVHPPDHLRPSAPEGRAVRSFRRRGTLGCFAWGGGFGGRGGLLAFAAGRVRREAVVAGQMAPAYL